MINVNEQVIRLETKNTTYAFRISDGYPEHLYYGRRLLDADFTAVALKNTIDLGETVKTESSKFYLECKEVIIGNRLEREQSEDR